MTPKTIGAYTEISRQLLLQSTPAAEQVVRTTCWQFSAWVSTWP
jgi:hypothetical protein